VCCTLEAFDGRVRLKIFCFLRSGLRLRRIRVSLHFPLASLALCCGLVDVEGNV
jgi:hypothetical protein